MDVTGGDPACRSTTEQISTKFGIIGRNTVKFIGRFNFETRLFTITFMLSEP